MDLTQLDVSDAHSPILESAGLDSESSPIRVGGPPSEASSQEWDTVTDPESHPAA